MYVTDGSRTMILSLDKGYVRRREFTVSPASSHQLVCAFQFVPYSGGEPLDLLRFFAKGDDLSSVGSDRWFSSIWDAKKASFAEWQIFEDWIKENPKEKLFFFGRDSS